MEPAARCRAGSRREEGRGWPPRAVDSVALESSLWGSGGTPCRSRRLEPSPGGSEKRESLSRWVSGHIKKKVCVRFVESPRLSDAGKVVCVCGYPRKQHLDEPSADPADQARGWDPKKHVVERPTDAFGDIVFAGLGQKSGKYVRLSQDTPPRDIYRLMTDHWGLDVPSLLISVTGGAKDFSMKPRLKSVFRRGLVKVAQTTGAWIITGGSHAGVMKQVGEAVRAFSLSRSRSEGDVVAIGVATWGVVHNRESLVEPAGSFPAEYALDEEGQGRLTCLDSNHSHFLLVDDGTHGRYGVEIPLRARLEKFISEQTKERGGVAIKIPIVCVVLEGGPGTLDTIYNACANGTPCVVVEGSGRVADVLAQVAGLPVSRITVSLVQQKLGALFPDVPETFPEARLLEWTKKIQDIVRQRHLLTVFREGKDGQQDVDVAILQALLKASRGRDHLGHENWLHQLKLAVAWNRVDIARTEIFTDEWRWKPADLHPVMTAALVSNKPEFVRLFLESGVQLAEFVSRDTLLHLYRHLEPACLFSCKLRKALAEDPERPAGPPRMHHVSRVLRELLGDTSRPLYPPTRDGRPPHAELQVQAEARRSCLPGCAASASDPVRDLLIWAVVQNRRELAEIVWAQSQDCIAAALACTRILKELAKEEEDTDSLEATLALADEYEHRAIGVFTECHRKDEARAQKLLTRVSEAWGETTCLQLALDAKDMKFVSHGGVQAFLTKVWWGQLCVDNGLWRVLLCMVAFPLLGTGLVAFRERPRRSAGGLWRLRAFFSAPVVVFHLNVLSYFAFLCLFAYVLMVDFQPAPARCEWVVYAWLFSLVCEELRQLLYDPHGSGRAKTARLYFSDFWNRLDMAAILLFAVGLGCRLTPGLLYPGRVVLSLDFSVFCLRLMHIFTVSRTLGPKIIILKRMMKDVFFFLFLLAVWVVSFGVAKQAILIHNESRVDWLFRGVLYQSYLAIFGQIPPYVDSVTFSPDECSADGSDPYKPKCPESDAARQQPAFPEWLTVTLLCLYLLFTNILLLNLLVAMFNYTFQEVQEHTDQIWKFQRHSLIEEYQGRPPAPPPLILASHVQLLLRRAVLRIPARRHRQLKDRLQRKEEAELLSWEACLREDYLQQLQRQRTQRPERRLQDLGHKVDAMLDLLEGDRLKQPGSLERRLASLEEQVAAAAQALRSMADTLRAAGVGQEQAPAPAPPEAADGRAPGLDGRLQAEDPGDAHHVQARQLLYPGSPVVRFPVPNEKVPWATEFVLYDPPFHTAEDEDAVDSTGSTPEPLASVRYNSVDGAVDRRSFHGPYAVQDGFPLNPMGRTGLRGRGSLSCFGPNHTLQPVVTRWRRNQAGAVCRRSLRKVLEVLVLTGAPGELWALPGGPREAGELLPRPLRQALRRQHWASFEKLLAQGTEVYRGYVDDARNTDNAWVETVAVSVHFPDQHDAALSELDPPPPAEGAGPRLEWQVVDGRVPLLPTHKPLLREVAALLGAHY